MGARYNAFTSQEMTAYYANVLPEFTEKAVEHLLRMQLHSVRVPGYLSSVEVTFGQPGERLLLRHDAIDASAPYVSGTLLAVRRVREWTGLRRGLDTLLDL